MLRTLCFSVLFGLMWAGCADSTAPDEPTVPASMRCHSPCAASIANTGDAFEPDLGISPVDPDHWVVAHTPIEGLRTLRAHVTFDGGQTWQISNPLEASLQGVDLRLDGCQEWIDAGAAVSATGTAWVVAIGRGPFGESFNGGFTGPVVAFESPDGGLTWTLAHVLSPSESLRQPCREAATTGQNFFHAPDMSRIVIGSNGQPIVTWRHWEGGQIGEGSYGVGVATWNDGWSTTIAATEGECSAASGPQPFVGHDGILHAATLSYDSTGVTHGCVLQRTGGGFVGSHLGAATLAWPRGTACNGANWMVHQNATQLIISTWNEGWQARMNISVGQGPATPSINCMNNAPVVTAFVPDRQWAFEAWWLPDDGLQRITLGQASKQTMGLSGMGHYMDMEGVESDAVVAWVSDEQATRRIYVARLTATAP